MEAHLFGSTMSSGRRSSRFAGKPTGPCRKDDRLILSRIMQVLKASANFQLGFRPKGK
jgi:hypothetical protein